MIESYGAGHGRGVHRRAGRRRDAGRGGAVRGLLAVDRRGVPPARGARDRRRGDDRLRSHGAMVRRGALGRAARHRHRRARAPRAGTCRSGSRRARGEVYETVAAEGRSSTGSPGRTTRWVPRSRSATLRRLRDDGLVERAATSARSSRATCTRRSPTSPTVGDVRGLGMMIGIELVRDRDTKEPFLRAEQVTERVLAAARDAGLLLYSLDRPRRRPRRRPADARAAVRPDRRGRDRAGRAHGRRDRRGRVSGASGWSVPEASPPTTTVPSTRSGPSACC